PGEVMGTRQTGLVQFKIADLNRDADLLEAIQKIAEHFLQHSAQAIAPLCARWLGDATAYAEV
ncbi:MAG: hypothetical protein ABL925_08075, partial [Methylococcales bacterium]